MKSLILFAACLMLAFTSFSQNIPKASLGVKAGPSLYTISGDDDEGIKSRVNFHGGLFYQLPLGKAFQIQPELVFSGEGFKGEDEDTKVTAKLNYLNIPVMLQWRASSGVVVETGPQLGFLMSAKMKIEVDGEKEEESFKDECNKTNFSWGFGLGYMKSRMGVGLRYNLGFSDVMKDVGSNKSNGFQFSFLVRFSE